MFRVGPVDPPLIQWKCPRGGTPRPRGKAGSLGSEHPTEIQVPGRQGQRGMALWAGPHFPSPLLVAGKWTRKGHGKDMAPAAYPQSWTPLVIKEVGDDFNHHQGDSRTELLTQIHTCTQCAQCNTHINTTTHMYTEATHVHNHTCTQITHMHITHVKNSHTVQKPHDTGLFIFTHAHKTHIHIKHTGT